MAEKFTHWEYLLVSGSGSDLLERLNEAGREGWRVVPTALDVTGAFKVLMERSARHDSK
jgi:hypothetical protein